MIFRLLDEIARLGTITSMTEDSENSEFEALITT